MAPNGETMIGSYSSTRPSKNFSKPPRLSVEGLQRTTSDISLELSKEVLMDHEVKALPPISEVEDAKCECCGMSEECTLQYIQRVRDKFSGKWICGLCSEAVKEEVEKNGGKGEEAALTAHMNVCVRFNRLGRAYPALYQAEAVREILKKSNRLEGRSIRAKSYSPRERCDLHHQDVKKGGIMRTSSCIPAITKEINDRKSTNNKPTMDI